MQSNSSLQPPELTVCTPADNAASFGTITLTRKTGGRHSRLSAKQPARKQPAGSFGELRGLVKPVAFLVVADPAVEPAEHRSEDSWIADLYAWNTKTPRDCIVEKMERGRYTGFDVLP